MNYKNSDEQSSDYNNLNQQRFINEVTARFGLLPNFFGSAQHYLMQDLWRSAKSAYLDSPLPSLFKERLFVYLSRLCPIRYNVVRHAGFLIGLGNPAGDANAQPETPDQVIELVKRPYPGVDGLAQVFSRLEAHEWPVVIPSPRTMLEADLFDALSVIYLEPLKAERARRAVRRAIGDPVFEVLTAFLSYVHTAQYWSESNPDLAFEPDVTALMTREEELSRLLLTPAVTTSAATSEEFKHIVTQLANVREREVQTAKALSKSEKKYHSLFNATDEGFVLFDIIYSKTGDIVDLRYLETNPAFKNVSGLTDVVGKTAFEVNPTMESYWLQTVSEVVSSGKSQRLEAYVKGLERWLNVCFMRLDDDNKYIVAALFDDVTNRKRLEISSTFLASLSNDFAQIKTSKEIIQVAAKQIADYFKLTRCLFVHFPGKHTGTLIVDWRLEGTTGIKAAAELSVHDLVPDEYRPNLLNGETVVINDSHRDLTDFSGANALLNSQAYVIVPIVKEKQLCFLAAILYPFARNWRRDEIQLIKELTERVWLRFERARTEEDLHYREAELTKVQEIGGVGGVDIDMKSGVRRWRSPEYISLHGLPSGKTAETREDWLNRVHPEDRERADQVIQQLLHQRQKNYTNEYRIIRPSDKQVRWILAKGDVEYDDHGNPIRLIGAHIDITERKIREEAQRESQERQAFLVKLNDTLRPIVNARHIQAAASRMLGEYLNVNCVSYSEVDGNDLVIGYVWVNGIQAINSRIKFTDFGKALVDDYLAGRTVIVEDVNTDTRFTAQEREVWRRANLRSSIAVTMVKSGEWVAILGIQSIAARKWPESQIKLVEDVAERTWAAVERAQTEVALRKSEKQFRTVVNLVPDLLWINEPDGQTNWYNQRWFDYTGQTFEEAINYGWLDVIHPDDREQSADKFKTAIKELRPLKQEHRIRSARGEYRWFLIQAVPVYKENGDIWHWVGASTDINERKESERQLEKLNILLEQQVAERTSDLQESRKLLQATLDSTADMIQVFEAVRDDSGKIVDFIWILNNNTSEQYHGQVIGKSLLKHNPGVVPEGIFEKFVQVTETGKPQQYEVHYVHEQFNGWFHQSAVKLNDGVATSTADITNRKKAEIELINTKELLDAILESQTVSLSAFKAVRNSRGHIVDLELIFVNKDLKTPSGDGDIGKYYLNDNLEAQPASVMDKYRLVIESGQPYESEWPYDKDGVKHWYRTVAVKLGDGLLIAEEDITPRKQAEELLKETNNLLQSVFDTTLIGMACHIAERDQNGNIVDFRIKMVNPELERLTGRNDLVGKLYGEEFPGIKHTVVFEAMLQVMKTGEPVQLEYSYPYDGFEKWFSSMFVKMDDGLVATNLDITERKIAEEERYKNLMLLHETEEVAELGSWEYSLQTGLSTWSDGMYRLFDLKKGTNIATDVYLQYATNDSKPAAARIIEYLKSGEPAFDETLQVYVNNEVKTIKLKAMVAYDTEGHPVKVLGVNMDITASRLAAERIRKLEIEQQQEIFRATLNTQEEERKRIAESLHNGLGQLLYGVKLSLDQINLNRTDNMADNGIALQQTKRLLGDSIKETRRISHELMPSILEDFGLREAVEDICRQLSSASVHFHCAFAGVGRDLDKYMEIAIYRITQELMINVIKHADATRASAYIEVNDIEVVLTVEDNGKGFDTSKIKNKGIGLPSIRSKVNLLNGKINISSTQGFGSTIVIRIPHKRNQTNNQ